MHEVGHDQDGLDGKNSSLLKTLNCPLTVHFTAIDVVLKRENTSDTFERTEVAGYEEMDGYRCYTFYLFKQLAESRQSDDCIRNAESWALLNVLVWLTRTQPKYHWTSGEARLREGAVPDCLHYTRRQGRDKTTDH